ncbi:MAG: ABC transporter substrate-binding protein [Gaiellaceae bacterium]
MPDLATSLASPADGARTYAFTLRPGIRYSTGRPLQATDFRTAIKRLFKVHSPALGYYAGIVGGARCAASPSRCDLSRGIVTDDAARTVTFHLSAPDYEFPYKLGLPFASAVPADAPSHAVGTHPLPATGPYMISQWVPGHRLVLVRNPFFKEWSQAAQPAGYPDRIVLRLPELKSSRRDPREVERGALDYVWGSAIPKAMWNEVQTRFASQLHSGPSMSTQYLALNTRVAPFDDVRVRRALNYALDRVALINTQLGLNEESPACQVLPPNFAAYRPYCPYTSPDLARAKRLVTASGTRGELVTVTLPFWGRPMGHYIESVLRSLGYRTSLTIITDPVRYSTVQDDSRYKVQLSVNGWIADYPAPSGFIIPALSCRAFTAADPNNGNVSEFCDPAIDAEMRHAVRLQATDTQAANALWSRIDHQLTDAAPWVPYNHAKDVAFVSKRVGNYQDNPEWGVLLSQLWVR